MKLQNVSSGNWEVLNNWHLATSIDVNLGLLPRGGMGYDAKALWYNAECEIKSPLLMD